MSQLPTPTGVSWEPTSHLPGKQVDDLQTFTLPPPLQIQYPSLIPRSCCGLPFISTYNSTAASNSTGTPWESGGHTSQGGTRAGKQGSYPQIFAPPPLLQIQPTSLIRSSVSRLVVVAWPTSLLLRELNRSWWHILVLSLLGTPSAAPPSTSLSPSVSPPPQAKKTPFQSAPPLGTLGRISDISTGNPQLPHSPKKQKGQQKPSNEHLPNKDRYQNLEL